MDAIEAIMTRRSVRNYLDKPIEEEALNIILKAAMSGPSCTNARDWHFIVVRDKAVLEQMAAANGRPADPLKRCPLGILVCGDLERAFRPAPDYWIIDGAIAAQNMTLAAHALGIGSVWLGTYPQMERVNNQIKLFNLPDTAVPHSVIAFGYPDPDAKDLPPGPPPGEGPHGEGPGPRGEGEPPMGPPPGRPGPMVKGAFEPDRIHYDKW